VKVCARCRLHRPFEDFNRNRSKKDGLQPYCRPCHNLACADHYQTNRASYLERSRRQRDALRCEVRALKESTSCADCGQRHPHYLMEFDHVPERGPKLWTISTAIGSASRAVVLAEIAKCDIVCSLCHSARTWYRQA
jgi:hypothetical protein